MKKPFHYCILLLGVWALYLPAQVAASPTAAIADAKQTYSLVTAVSGQGVITPAAGTHEYTEGTVVAMSATPDSEWAFDRWEGDLSGTNPFNRSLVMTGNKSVTAVFSPQAHTLTIGIDGLGSTIPPAGAFPTLHNREIEVYAYSPDPGTLFHHWEGDVTGKTNPAKVLMDADKSITAVFHTSYSLNTAVEGLGALDPPAGFRWVSLGSEVTITALPETGWIFNHWTGDFTGVENPAVFEMDTNKSITAVFTEAEEVFLTTLTTGNGTVDPPDTTSHLQGTPVTLTATPQTGWRFLEWQGAVTDSENPATFVIFETTAVTAVFEQIPQFVLTTQADGNGTVSPSGASFQYEDSNVQVEATPAEGWEFVRWEGAVASADNPVLVLMDGDKTLVAVFSRIPVYYTLTLAVTGEGSLEPAAGQHSILEDTITVITPTPADGWLFDHWEGDLTGSDSPAEIEMTANKSITAVFVSAVIDIHTADQDQSHSISLSELLRVIQFFNTGAYHCATGTEDGYAPGLGMQECTAHASDYAPQDWQVSLTELLRLIQFFNTGAYHACEGGEDGFCPGPVEPTD